MPTVVEDLRSEFLELIADAGPPPLTASCLALSRLLQDGDQWSGARDELRALEAAAVPRCRRLMATGPDAAAEAIMDVMREAGFVGDTEDYENISNSFIDRVLQRRRGLPITLSVLALHLAGVSGVPLRGIGFPGHFIVGTGIDTRTPAIFDPFNDGRRLSFSDLAALYEAATGRRMIGEAPLLRDCLKPASTQAILSRMLRNLQRHYALRGAHDRATEVVGLLVALHPELDDLQSLQGRLSRRLATLN